MQKFYFSTTNPEKLEIAKTVCAKAELDLVPVKLDITEIQGENPELIVREKVRYAYKKVGQPIVVSDDFWDIHTLKGFPGAYMKSINYWFTPKDFLRLMRGLKNRKITLHQYLAFSDGNTARIFNNDLHGKIVDKPRGVHIKSPNMTVIELENDNGMTIAEVFGQSNELVTKHLLNRSDVWHDFINWYKKDYRL